MNRYQQEALDSFILESLPPEELRPSFINKDLVIQASPLNCITELLDNAVNEGHGDNVAIYSLSEAITYLRLLEKTNQIANYLVDDLGMTPGNRVILRAPNCPMLAACWLAVIKAGGVVVTTIAMLRSKEISTVIQQSEATIALCDFRLKAELTDASSKHNFLRHIIYFSDDSPSTSNDLNNVIKNKSTKFKSVLVESSVIAMIAFTSGTTGRPKGAMHSHHAILAVCETFSKQVVKASSDDIFSGTPPLGFVYGLGGLLLFPLHARASTVLLEDVSLKALIEAISRFKISILFTAPTAYKALLENFSSEELGSLKSCISAGEPLPPYVTKGWLEKTDIRLIDGIGSTELLHIFMSVQSKNDPLGCLGKAVPGYEVQVIDNDGNELNSGELGYLAVKGPTGCLYLNDERQTQYVINGWNVTGDTVIKDNEGFYWYQSRTDGMIISSGYNISGPDVEQTLSLHPAVAECAVTGVRDTERGQIVRAYIILNEGFSPDNELIRNIQNFFKQKSAPYKYPRSIKFIDFLPRTPTGKVQHYKLKELLSEKT